MGNMIILQCRKTGTIKSVERSQWGLKEEQVILLRAQERFLGIGNLEKCHLDWIKFILSGVEMLYILNESKIIYDARNWSLAYVRSDIEDSFGEVGQSIEGFE